MAKIELEPCRFCGSIIVTIEECREPGEYGQFRAYCEHCFAYGPPGDSKEEAADFWNGKLL